LGLVSAKVKLNLLSDEHSVYEHDTLVPEDARHVVRRDTKHAAACISSAVKAVQQSGRSKAVKQ
jgi:hypothetical protein